MNHQSITKDVFLTGVECSTKGWFSLHGDGGEGPTEGDLLRMSEGIEIHQRARSLHPNGIFAGNQFKTNELILDSTVKLIFEAAFKVDGFAARADWIRRVRGGWMIGEIKSSLHNEDETATRHIEDIAYTTMVLRRAGLSVKGCEIVLMNRDWRLGMSDDELFVVTDITEEATAMADSFNRLWDQMRINLLRKTRLGAHLNWSCRNCEHFENECVGKGVRDPIFCLPYLKEKRFGDLIEMGALSIHQIPTEYALSEKQEVVATAIRSGTLQADTLYIEEAWIRLLDQFPQTEFTFVRVSLQKVHPI
ncbi:MAG: hypothetical protein JKX70_11580 [Phycisphaerales bacterium]|nr:hypothetical protein [Phycisphaerales bacterium]